MKNIVDLIVFPFIIWYTYEGSYNFRCSSNLSKQKSRFQKMPSITNSCRTHLPFPKSILQQLLKH